MSEDKTVRIEPREPDPVRASNILAGIPARTEAMFAAFQAINRRERKAPPWRELQILNFIRYVKMYADDLARSYEAQRIDSVAQAMRNLLEMCIWTEFCEISEANAKRFSDDAARDMRDMMEAVQALYISVNQTPETRLAGMIADLKSKAPAFDIRTGEPGEPGDRTGEPGNRGEPGDRREVSPTPKPPIVMSQTSLVKQTSESVPSVLGLPVRARRWRTILLPEQPP